MSAPSNRETPETGTARAERDALIATTVMDLRSPLSRIELAASRLFREDMPPRAQDLATTIREAVSSIDRQLDLALRALAPRRPGQREAISDVAQTLTERMAPVLLARGFQMEVAEFCESWVDPTPVRRAALVLARVAMELGQPGPVRFSFCDSGEGLSVEVAWPSHVADANTAVSVQAAQLLALAAQGQLRVSEGSAAIWLPSAEVCP